MIICRRMVKPTNLLNTFLTSGSTTLSLHVNQTKKESIKMSNRMDDIIISGHNMELTPALKSTVLEKVTRLFEHEPHIIRLRIELDAVQSAHNEKEFAAKGHIEIKGKPLIVNVSSDDLYKSIDELVQKLDRKIRRRSRLRILKRKQPHSVDIPANLPKVQTA